MKGFVWSDVEEIVYQLFTCPHCGVKNMIPDDELDFDQPFECQHCFEDIVMIDNDDVKVCAACLRADCANMENECCNHYDSGDKWMLVSELTKLNKENPLIWIKQINDRKGI